MKAIPFVLFILFFVNCDRGGPLLLKDNESGGVIEIDGIRVETRMTTMGNISVSLYMKFILEQECDLYLDSLKIFYMKNPLVYERMWLNGKIISTADKVTLNKGESRISYGFYLGKIKKGDEFFIFADNYIQKNEKYFSIDTLEYIVPRNF